MSSELDEMADKQAVIATEVRNILEDVLFIRAPIQTRLLKYLLEQTTKGGEPPKQCDIAITGLGRDPDFDSDSDSYARVQVSRLRHNLDNYYARYRPSAGHRIIIKPGTYLLALKPETQRETGEHSKPRCNNTREAKLGHSMNPTNKISDTLNFAFGFVAAIVLVLLVLLAAQIAMPIAAA